MTDNKCVECFADIDDDTYTQCLYCRKMVDMIALPQVKCTCGKIISHMRKILLRSLSEEKNIAKIVTECGFTRMCCRTNIMSDMEFSRRVTQIKREKRGY